MNIDFMSYFFLFLCNNKIREIKLFTNGLKILTNPEDPGSIITFKNIYSNKITSNEITSIYKDRTGVIFFSMYGAGFCTTNLNKKVFSEYYFPELKQNNEIKTITSIYEDEKGILWIGVRGQNLVLFDPETKKTYRYFNVLVIKNLSDQSNTIVLLKFLI